MKYITRTFHLTVLCMVVAIASIASAQSSAMTNGVFYLQSTQTVSGYWGGAEEAQNNAIIDTAAAVDTLITMGVVESTCSRAHQWLTNVTASNNDYLFVQLLSLATADQTVSDKVAALIAKKNSDGAWGADDGFASDNNRTALALQALKAANYPDLSVSNTALAFLTNAQNTDGGFGFSSGDDSGIFMTAIVAATLEQYQQTATIANALTKAIAYLSLRQNSDGGFGYPASTVYETALAYTAMIGSGQASATAMQNALAYLSTTQSTNGSWNDDPYSTALALKALYLSEHIPTPPPAAATTGAIMGTIVDDTTKKSLSGVAVSLTTNPSISTTTDANGLFSLSGIPAGSQQIP